MEITAEFLSQTGMVLGFLGSITLAFSVKIGVLGSNGTIIFTGLDPMEPAENNAAKVKAAHRRNRVCAPAGWSMLSLAFLFQFTATLSYFQ